MRRYWYILLMFSVLAVAACTRDTYVKTMREGAKAFDKGDFTRAAGLFKETLQDTTFAGLYNYALASHEAEDDIEAVRALDTLRNQELVPEDYAVPAVLNLANARLTEAVREEAQEQEQEAQSDPEQDPQQGAMQGQKASTGLYQQAMQNYEEYLLEVPGDMDAKERYLFCKSKMPPQDQNGGGGGGDQNQDQQNQDQQDQDQNQNQDQNQDQNQNQDQQDQNQDQNKDQDQQNQQQQQQDQQDQLNEQQIYQMLEAKEKETREKMDEKKARAIQLRQKDRKKW